MSLQIRVLHNILKFPTGGERDQFQLYLLSFQVYNPVSFASFKSMYITCQRCVSIQRVRVVAIFLVFTSRPASRGRRCWHPPSLVICDSYNSAVALPAPGHTQYEQDRSSKRRPPEKLISRAHPVDRHRDSQHPRNSSRIKMPRIAHTCSKLDHQIRPLVSPDLPLTFVSTTYSAVKYFTAVWRGRI